MYSKRLFNIMMIFIITSSSIAIYENTATAENDDQPRTEPAPLGSDPANRGWVMYQDVGTMPSVSHPIFRVRTSIEN